MGIPKPCPEMLLCPKLREPVGKHEGMLTALVALEFKILFLYCKGTLCPPGCGSRAKIREFSFSVSLAKERMVLWEHRRELCLCLKWALSKEETCVHARVAREELEIGFTSCSMLRHIFPAGPAQSKCRAQGGSSLHRCSGRTQVGAPQKGGMFRWF